MFKKFFFIGMLCMGVVWLLQTDGMAGKNKTSGGWDFGTTHCTTKIWVQNLYDCDIDAFNGNCVLDVAVVFPIYEYNAVTHDFQESPPNASSISDCKLLDPMNFALPGLANLYPNAGWDHPGCYTPTFTVCINPNEKVSNSKKNKPDPNQNPVPPGWQSGSAFSASELSSDICPDNGICRYTHDILYPDSCNNQWISDDTVIDAYGYTAAFKGGFVCGTLSGSTFTPTGFPAPDNIHCCATNNFVGDSCTPGEETDEYVACESTARVWTPYAGTQTPDCGAGNYLVGTFNGLDSFPGDPLATLQRITLPVGWQFGDTGSYPATDCPLPSGGYTSGTPAYFDCPNNDPALGGDTDWWFGTL